MTRKEALAELIAKVEAGEWDAWSVGRALSFNDGRRIEAKRGFEGSLDAAKALHEAVLPGWLWGRQLNGQMWVAKRPYTFRVAPQNRNFARAWLLAILRALHAMEADT